MLDIQKKEAMDITVVLQFFKKYYRHNLIKEELKDITEIRINYYNISSLPNGVVDKCINLHTLDLSNNNLTAIDPNTFVKCVNLHTLYLCNNNLTTIDPNTFVNNTNLHTLELYNNKLTAIEPNTFVNNVNLHTLGLSNNNLTEIDPNTFAKNVNLDTLKLSNNKLTAIDSNTFVNNVNLDTLDLSYNKLIAIEPNTFVNNVNLHTLELYNNKLTAIDPNTFVKCVNLHTLVLSNNNLTEIDPNTFVNNVNLHTLGLSFNNLSSLPLEIINLRNLQKFHYTNNPIENIHPVLMRFLNTIKNRLTETNRGIYSDGQSVHNSAIQESVRNSIISLLKDESKTTTIEATNLKEDIIKDDVLTADTKSLIFEYIQDTITHSSLYITFEDLFIKVWNRIKQHPQAVELKKILNEEMKGAECKCFTGRISRLVNVINGGYFDDIKISIQTADQIGNVILAIKERLEKEGHYSLEKQREISIKELTERGYEIDIIKVWTDEII